MTNLYVSPAFTPGTSTDQYPLSPSRASGCASADSPLKLPLTDTAAAFGAQTRKVVPSACSTAPIPPCGDGTAPDASGSTELAVDAQGPMGGIGPSGAA
jgi:hypothetical protein